MNDNLIITITIGIVIITFLLSAVYIYFKFIPKELRKKKQEDGKWK